MLEENEYTHVMKKLYHKSLILEDPSDFHPVLNFYFVDAIAHLDFTLGMLAYNYMSPKNIMSMEYLRWRLDQESEGDRPYFPGFINWLKQERNEIFESLPLLWSGIYDSDDPACYRSFRIVLNPDDKRPIPAEYFGLFADQLFDRPFLQQIYRGSPLAKLFDEYVRSQKSA
ncbi:hypothetical protein FGU65_01210 [Methanoculleus sp. FWC-SCC1]|uniref:Uncharacterized protein n=1 Tax=Methanoculleus frigidifontis TaxID=2584085 RepID=A0ABT8M6G6_9EURY|nr:hypothetical protein [Methanoculleus sp. FWC-SCC1]MDN7023531.1 hypothetical protein [Methanoculleus sp. FWC-SCC1]